MSLLIIGFSPSRLSPELRRRILLADSKRALQKLARELVGELGRHVSPELIGKPEDLQSVRARLAASLHQVFGVAALESAVREELTLLREELVPPSEPPADVSTPATAVEGASDETYECFRDVYCDPEHPDDPDWCTWEEWCDEEGNPSDRTCWYFGADGIAREQDCPEFLCC